MRKPKESLALVETQTAPLSQLSPALMLSDAIKAGAAVEVLEKLMAMQERWEANQARKAFNNAMADARIELPSILKNREVDFTSTRGRTNYKYEDLNAVTGALSPVLAKCGLSFRWRTVDNAGGVTVTCIVSHRDGHSEETALTAKYDNSGNKNEIQALGSAVTYLQRYTLKAAFGVAAAHDDDGNSVPHQASPHDGNPANKAGFDDAMKADQQAHAQRGTLHDRNKAHDHLEEVMKEWREKRNKTAEEALQFLAVWSVYQRKDGTMTRSTRVVQELSEKEAIICRRAFEDDIKYGDTNWRLELSNRIVQYTKDHPAEGMDEMQQKRKILKDLTDAEYFNQIDDKIARQGVNKFDKALAEKGTK